MANSRYITHIIALFLWFLCTFAAGQKLPQMPVDPNVKSGVLPNGTNYYLMANADTKGMADFALVQKTSAAADLDPLALLPALGNLSPRKFLSENGVSPKEGRFIEMRDSAVVYRFSDVMISSKPELMDSTLLVLMGMIHADSSCAPSESAIIVSGDIKPDATLEKIKMLSLMIPAGKPAVQRKYAWADAETAFSAKPSSGNISSISVGWRLPRTPDTLASTIQPAVHEKLMDELGRIACGRVRKAFIERDIPFAGITFRHISSAETSADEFFGISATTVSSQMIPAVAAVADALSSVTEKGVSVGEHNRSASGFIHGLFDQARRPVRSDAANVELCINAFLNKSTPVTDAWRYDFHMSKDVNDTTETLALDRMADAVMRVDRNMDVRFHTSSDVSADSLKRVFLAAWSSPSVTDEVAEVAVSDTLKNVFPAKPGKKMPVILMWKEHLSGGTQWTFANGIKVVYKRMDTGGRYYWALGLSGGYGAIRNLEAGEGAFVGDMLRLSKVAGMPWDDYMAFLESREIYMGTSVGLYNTIIRGSAPTYEMPLLMRSLSAITNEREFDGEAFNPYRRNEWLRLEMTASSSRRVVDSLMCPGYRYSNIKTSGKLSEALPAKAEALFSDVFSKVNDGVLVIIGDKEESLVRQQLREYMGCFSTGKRVPARTSVSYQPISGAMTHVSAGHRNAVYLAMSVPMPLTIESYAVSEVAGMILSKRLESALVGSGMYAKVYHDTRIAPDERFNMMIVLEEVPGVSKEGAEQQARRIVREVLDDKGLSEITDAQVNTCKVWLKHNRSVRVKSPDYWVNALLLRHLEGKDFTTGYDKKLDGVSTDHVRALLSSVNDSGKVEYIKRKK